MRSSRWIAAAALISGMSLVGLPLAGAGVAGASANSPGSPPPANAPMSSWQTWASSQRGFVSTFDWSSWTEGHACTATTVTVIPVTANGTNLPGIPAGIVTDAVSLSGECANATGSVSPDSNASPNTAYCPNLTYCNTKSIRTGVAAVGTATVGGNPNYMGAAYTKTTSGTITGHSRLGTSGTACGPGNLVANASNTAIGNGGYNEVLWGPRNASNYWSATYYKQHPTTPSKYTVFGTVCGLY